MDTDLSNGYFVNPYDDCQAHTQANIESSYVNIGFKPTISLEEGIKAYIPEIKLLHDADPS